MTFPVVALMTEELHPTLEPLLLPISFWNHPCKSKQLAGARELEVPSKGLGVALMDQDFWPSMRQTYVWPSRDQGTGGYRVPGVWLWGSLPLLGQGTYYQAQCPACSISCCHSNQSLMMEDPHEAGVDSPKVTDLESKVYHGCLNLWFQSQTP